MREQLVAAARRVAAAGLALGTAGNVSVRDGELIAITPTGATLETVTAGELALVAPDGEVRGDAVPSSELALHLEIYRRFGDRAGAVVHTHPPVASALACVADEVPVIHYQMMWLGGSVRVAPYATFGSVRLAELTVAALEGRSAALMAQHGAIVYAGDLHGAVDRTLLLEWLCGVYWRARCLGTPRTLDSAEQLDVLAAASLGRPAGRGEAT